MTKEDLTKKSLWTLVGRDSPIGDSEIHEVIIQAFYRLPEYKELCLKQNFDEIQHPILDDTLFSNPEFVDKVKTRYQQAVSLYLEFEKRFSEYEKTK
jgi:hypothetical protein